MNQEKLKKLQEQVRIGGKGSARRKRKIIHVNPASDEKKLQSSIKKLPLTAISGIEEVNIFKNDGTVIHFNNPKAQASIPTNTFTIHGQGDVKQIVELLPNVIPQLGPDLISRLRKMNREADEESDGEVPDLVGNFDKACIDGEDADGSSDSLDE